MSIIKLSFLSYIVSINPKTMKIHRLSIPVILFVLTTANHAQDGEKFSRNQATKITSEILDEPRQISIYLPDDYAYSKTRYPVLYLLDGGTHLQHASAAVDYHSGRGTIPDIIVVAIHNIDRSRDFSPVHVENFPTSGGAEKFLGFLSKELVPYLDKNYRTAGFDILLGHSLGGTFISYTLLAEPELFDAYLAVSPYLMYADNLVVNKASEKLKPFKDTKYFYMTVGNEEPYFEALAEYADIMKEKAGESVEFRYVKMLDENHATTPYLSVFKGLRFIFKGWQLPIEMLQSDLETIDDYFESISKKFGLEVATPEQVINALGYRYLQVRQYEIAIAIFQENVSRYPESANVYDSLGEAYENHGKTELAANNYQKAVMLGEKNGDANLSVYRANLERVSKN
jgi:predicted alpha/beta superfamily hydrolase